MSWLFFFLFMSERDKAARGGSHQGIEVNPKSFMKGVIEFTIFMFIFATVICTWKFSTDPSFRLFVEDVLREDYGIVIK